MDENPTSISNAQNQPDVEMPTISNDGEKTNGNDVTNTDDAVKIGNGTLKDGETQLAKDGEDVEMEVEDKKTNESADEEDDGDESDDESEEGQSIEPLATTRSRRTNAGNRMSNLIQEEEDDFYKNLYGGFHEEEDDGDFDSEDEADEDEVEEDYDVDSDFSIDETDEIAPEHQLVEEESRKKRNAYKEPKARTPHVSTSVGPSSSTPVQQKGPKAGSSHASSLHSPGKHRAERSFRDSTKKKTAETIKNIETVKKRKKFRTVEPHIKLTQEELLEEAKKTEEENLRSLEMYQRLESEKLKKIKMIKKSIPTPYVTYYSSVFTNPETKEKYSRNLCTYVGCEPQAKTVKLNANARSMRSRS